MTGNELRDWRDRYVEYHRAQHPTAATWGRLQSELTRLCNWLGDRELTIGTLREYETHLLLHGNRGQPLRKSSVETYKTGWHGFTKFVAEGLGRPEIEIHLKPYKRHETETTTRRVLTDAEVEAVRFVARSHPVWYDVFMTYALTGVRVSEGLAFRYSDLTPDGLIVQRGKGCKKRIIDAVPELREIWERNRDADCLTMLAAYPDRNAIRALCNTLAERAKIPAFGPHSIRHWWATRLLAAGVPMKVVSVMLGHSSITTTEKIYCHLTEVHIKGACDGLNFKKFSA